MDSGSIIVGLLAGAFGLAYLVYGKRSMDFAFLISGFLLMLYPFIVSNLTASVVIGLILVAGPIILNRFY